MSISCFCYSGSLGSLGSGKYTDDELLAYGLKLKSESSLVSLEWDDDSTSSRLVGERRHLGKSGLCVITDNFVKSTFGDPRK